LATRGGKEHIFSINEIVPNTTSLNITVQEMFWKNIIKGKYGIKQSYLSTFSVFFKGRFYVTLYFAYKGIVGFSAGDIMPEVPAPQAVLQNPVLRLTRRPVGVIPGHSICPLPASLHKEQILTAETKQQRQQISVYIYHSN
jgi:hypothetical protein